MAGIGPTQKRPRPTRGSGYRGAPAAPITKRGNSFGLLRNEVLLTQWLDLGSPRPSTV